jgi:hypothetical protein
MNINDAFPSKYFKASDVETPLKLKIRNVAMERMQSSGDDKPVVTFTNTNKSLVLNQTNANTLTEAWGADTNAWSGEVVELYTEMVAFGRGQVPGIRVRIPGAAPRTAAARAQAMQQPPASGFDDLDDEIPFAWVGALLVPWALTLLGGGGLA